ncbi:MAG TPA: hypothetical protein V6C90_03420 [Coleofasciculaceae cyanobacterium]
MIVLQRATAHLPILAACWLVLIRTSYNACLVPYQGVTAHET